MPAPRGSDAAAAEEEATAYVLVPSPKSARSLSPPTARAAPPSWPSIPPIRSENMPSASEKYSCSGCGGRGAATPADTTRKKRATRKPARPLRSLLCAPARHATPQRAAPDPILPTRADTARGRPSGGEERTKRSNWGKTLQKATQNESWPRPVCAGEGTRSRAAAAPRNSLSCSSIERTFGPGFWARRWPGRSSERHVPCHVARARRQNVVRA